MADTAMEAQKPDKVDPLLESLREATIGDYEVLAELGRGGMAVVYLAHDLSLDRKVAIKVMMPALARVEGAAERFKREARTAASLTHPSIIPIYAVRQQESLIYFVMQFVPGRTLDTVIDERGQLPVPMVQEILVQVGEALAYAHKRGVIHRDIKPGNILLSEDGRATVTDFGIAKVSAAESLTQTGNVVGTPSYMSPEQCTASVITGASDQYCLGLIGYEMLTGKQPFTGATAVQLMYVRCTEDPRPIEEARPDCPPALQQAIMRMLAREPDDRWPQMADAVAAVGMPAAPERDHVRQEMATLAATGMSQRILAAMRTPTSPVPGTGASRPRTVTLPAQAGRPALARVLLYGLPLAAVAMAAWALIRNPRPGTPAAAPDTLPRAAVAPAEAPAVAGLRLSPAGAISLDAGDSADLSAAALDSAGAPVTGAAFSWRSSDPSVAAISAQGRLRGLAPGVATIVVQSGGVTGATSVTVRPPAASAPPPRTAVAPPTVAELRIVAPAESLAAGGSMRLQATPLDAAGRPLSGRVAWRSGSPAIAAVETDGTVSAVSEGNVTITATSGAASKSIVLRVVPPPAATVEIEPAGGGILVGQTLQLSATARAADGRALRDRATSWTSSDTAVAPVTASGVVSGRSAGQAVITALLSGRRAQATIAVRAPAVEPPAPHVPTAQENLRGIEAALTAFTQAVTSRDMTRLQRAYPGMTQPEEQAYRELFRGGGRFDLNLVSQTPAIDGTTATVTGTAHYHYYEPRDLEQTFSYRAVLDGASGTWRLTSIVFAQQ